MRYFMFIFALIPMLVIGRSLHANEFCSIDKMYGNLDVAQIDNTSLDGKFITSSPDPLKWLNQQKAVPCSLADLLKLDFEIRSTNSVGNFPAKEKNNDSYILQRGRLVLVCNYEYSLDNSGEKVTGSRAACSQIVPYRTLEK